MYWSRYDENAIATLAGTFRKTTAEQVWCVFDNTASGAAIENACELRERLIAVAPRVNCVVATFRAALVEQAERQYFEPRPTNAG